MRQSIKQLLQRANKIIPPLESEILLSSILKKPREYMLTHSDARVGYLKSYRFNNFVKKRNLGVPIAYLIGHKEFYGLDFEVNKYTLIPRPDTEILVENTISHISKNDTLIDVGTGSGCIAISVLKKKKNTAYAIDISKRALTVAKKNARLHGVKINFLHGNLLQPLKHKNIKTLKHIIITANLPYLTKKQFSSEPSIQYEPKSALVADKQGLALYEALLNQIKSISTSYKLQATSYLEIDPSQTSEITLLIQKIFPEVKIEIKKDLAGHNRLVIFTLTQTKKNV
ncbi:MAG: peptide chain release factor N(5)-glutamine methyltransferase [bacterium]|nr:peptide chain release factor N(5)-glutamine methyltransferase [bacterium]